MYLIAAAIAVVWCRKDRDNISIMTPVVTFHYQLMCASNESDVVGMIKLIGNVLAKRIPCSTWGYTPATSIVRIRPQHYTFEQGIFGKVEEVCREK